MINPKFSRPNSFTTKQQYEELNDFLDTKRKLLIKQISPNYEPITAKLQQTIKTLSNNN
jgi:hypothetical protein